MNLGERVRRARAKRGWTQAQLCEAAKISQSTLSRIERGHRVGGKHLTDVLAELGLDPELLEPAVAAPLPVLEAHVIRTMPSRLGLELDIDSFIHPERGGDFFSFVPVAPAEVLFASVDVAGNGPAAMPAARYLQGWIRGRALAAGAPRLDVLADDLRKELAFSGIDAAWYLALLASPNKTTLRYQAVADSFPAPLLLTDEAGRTHPSLAKSEPGEPLLIIESFRPPVTLAAASDGMLRRLGGGDEQAGKHTLRRWLTGERRRWAIDAQFGAGQHSNIDEALTVLRWSPWDERYIFDIADANARHGTQRDIRARALESIGARANDLGRALTEALNNALEHAYEGRHGEVEVAYRASDGRVEVEIRDYGDGEFNDGDGMALIRRSCAAQFFRGPGRGHVVYLSCTVGAPK